MYIVKIRFSAYRLNSYLSSRILCHLTLSLPEG
jgi:hypothetical protein